jgi:DNA polymerase I
MPPFQLPRWSYRLLSDEREARLYLERAASSPRVAFDIETSQILPFGGRIAGISFGFYDQDLGGVNCCYIPLYHVASDLVSEDWFHDNVVAFLVNSRGSENHNPDRVLIAHNAGFEWAWFRHLYDVDLDIGSDTMLVAFVDDGNRSSRDDPRSVGLKELSKELYGHEPIKFEDVCGRGKKQKPITQVPATEVVEYGSQDSWLSWAIDRDLHEQARVKSPAIFKVEMMLWKVVATMRMNGVLLDQGTLQEAEDFLIPQMLDLKVQVFRALGFPPAPDGPPYPQDPVDLESPQQLSHHIYEVMRLPAPRVGKSGYPSVSADQIKRLAIDYPAIRVLVEYRKIHYLLNNFVQKQMGYVNSITGRIHGDLFQCGAPTGRFAARDPNLQNIIKSGDDWSYKRIARRVYVPTPGYYFLDVDYSQIELRIAASISREPDMLAAYAVDPPLDMHVRAYSKMTGIPIDKVTKDQRRHGKVLNFGPLYGMTPVGLATSLECSRQEAEEKLARYHEAFPVLKRSIDISVETAKRQGFIKTYYGRIRNFPNLTSMEWGEREHAIRGVFNTIIQGTSADIIKIAMVRLFTRISSLGLQDDIRMILQVHDEILFEVRETFPLDQVIELVRDCMEIKIPNFCPVKVEMELGYCWGDLFSLDNFLKRFGARINTGAMASDQFGGQGIEGVLGAMMRQLRDFQYPCVLLSVEAIDDVQAKFLTAITRAFPGKSVVYVQYQGRYLELPNAVTTSDVFVEKLQRGFKTGKIELFDGSGAKA